MIVGYIAPIVHFFRPVETLQFWLKLDNSKGLYEDAFLHKSRARVFIRMKNVSNRGCSDNSTSAVWYCI
jgi:hypothetical protein